MRQFSIILRFRAHNQMRVETQDIVESFWEKEAYQFELDLVGGLEGVNPDYIAGLMDRLNTYWGDTQQQKYQNDLAIQELLNSLRTR